MRSAGRQMWVGRQKGVTGPSEGDISEAYLYLLGRLLVLRQEHLDFAIDGFRWNQLVHREVGSVMRPNPDLDVARSDAWIAIDETSCTVIDLPPIVGRYFTVQIVNPWGETVANINERNFAAHSSGSFALCLRDAPVAAPPGTERVDVPNRKARVLLHLELGANHTEAVSLQHHVVMRAMGEPAVAPTIKFPLFTNDKLPGVTAFDEALAVLASEPDVNPGTEAMQTRVRAVMAWASSNDTERARIDGVIRTQAWRKLKQHVAMMGASGNGWVRPKLAGSFGEDWLMRTVTNYTHLWANNQVEVVEFTAGSTSPLDGSDTYSMTFDKDDLPSSHTKYFWSVVCVNAVDLHVTRNARNRFLIDDQSRVERASDGSLTLWFAPQKPDGVPDANWLPTPAGEQYCLTWRCYGPDQATMLGNWYPPRLHRIGVGGEAHAAAEFSIL